jgi:TetR/AcrR family transcriptional regulator, transcriptional repressor of bet genes
VTRRTYYRATEAERREDLIAATLDCVAEFGIEGATVRQIATRAGVTGGLIRHYFDSKDQMVQAAYRKLMTDMCAPSHAIANGKGSARERLRRFVQTNLEPPVAESRTISLWASFIGRIRVDPVFSAIHREHYAAFLSSLEKVVCDYFEEKGCPRNPTKYRSYAIALNGLIDGLWMEGTLVTDMFGETELADTALLSVERLLGLEPGELSATDET